MDLNDSRSFQISNCNLSAEKNTPDCGSWTSKTPLPYFLLAFRVHAGESDHLCKLQQNHFYSSCRIQKVIFVTDIPCPWCNAEPDHYVLKTLSQLYNDFEELLESNLLTYFIDAVLVCHGLCRL